MAMALALLWGLSTGAVAQDEPVDEVGNELERITVLLDREQAPARRWWWGWFGAFGGLTVGQGLIAATSKDLDVRTAMTIGAAGSLLGVGNMLINPYPARHGASALRGLPTDTPQERLAALQTANALFERTAHTEAAYFAWIAHAGGIAVSAASFGVLWFQYDLRQDAVVNLVGGLAITEAQIFTAPRRVHRAWKDDEGHAVARVEYHLRVEPRGIALYGRF